ncbi:MAG: hypothetical protein BWY56_01561 [Acidobacteria bacterium ADurb.Bin340]|nr:MAG: hypothetical protein BWY56_01561 [Acidobacteria bacterium ADurb.Bin340]
MEPTTPLDRLRFLLRESLERGWKSPWTGRLLVACLGLALLWFLATVGLGLWVVWSVATHGAGELRTHLPILWLVALWMVVPAGLGWVWFQFTRDGRGLKRDRLLEAAEQGDAEAILAVAESYRRRDPAAARAWLLQGARSGHAAAMRELARDLMEGRGGVRDLATAATWAERSEALGDPVAPSLRRRLEALRRDRFSPGAPG